MKRIALKSMVFFVLFGQIVHALGLCSYHFHEVDGTVGFHPHRCFCGHDSQHHSHGGCGHAHHHSGHHADCGHHQGQDDSHSNLPDDVHHGHHHQRPGDSHSPHGGHQGPCDSCVCSNDHPTPLPTRGESVNLHLDCFCVTVLCEDIVSPDRFAFVPENEKIPERIPLYLSLRTLLI